MFQISIFLPDWLCHSTRNDPRKNVSINDFILKSSHNLHEYDFKVTKIQKCHPFNEMDDSLHILCLFCTYWIWNCLTFQICIWLQINATKLCKERINASRHNMSNNFNHIISNIHYHLFYINILENIYNLQYLHISTSDGTIYRKSIMNLIGKNSMFFFLYGKIICSSNE